MFDMVSRMVNEATLNLADYLTVSEAAERMGVSPGTLRNWDRTGRLKAYRNPLNGYRLYRHSDLEALLLQIAKGNN
jgi:site-specific DNA-methyltransferase (adenine-specific)